MNQYWRWLLLIVMLLAIGCSAELSQLERIQKRGSLRVALVSEPPLYFPNESIIRGYNYEIAHHYATSIGVKLTIIHANTISDLVSLLKQGNAHIGISASLPPFFDDTIKLHSIYSNSNWYVIGNRNNVLPKTIDEIAPGKLITANDSRPALLLERLQMDHPNLFGLELPNSNTRQILEQINLNNFKLSIIDEEVYTYYQYLYPEIKIAFSLERQYPSYWLTNKTSDLSIFDSISNFIADYSSNGNLENHYNNYFQHLNLFNYLDTVYYLKRIHTTLPKYAAYFSAAAKKTGFDGLFLAAISYQESHWDEQARSPTGVRGLMMLTRDTAKRVGVNNRLNPEKSIMGGASYLKILHGSLPERIKEPDRSWMMLAAYNIGLGHLEDARVITERVGDNPDLWIDVEAHLPKLNQEEWYQKTKHGIARGHEPVAFVRKVRLYYDILRLYQQEELLQKRNTPLVLEQFKVNSPVF